MKKPGPETVGQRLRRFMSREDRTLVAVAQDTGLNVRTVWTIVHELHVPNPRTEYKLMKLMGEL